MKTWRLILVALVAVVPALGITGCSEVDENAVAIGYVGPLTTAAGLYGRNVQRGLEMAVAEINEAGGIQVGERTLELQIQSLDDQYRPDETATGARRLLQQYRTPVIFVSHAGGIRALQGMNTRQPRFLIGGYSSEPTILEAENPLTLMLPPRYDAYAPPFVEIMRERFGPRLGLIPTTTVYGRQWTQVVTAEWERQGGEVLRNNGVDYNTTTDFTGVVSRALSENPDVLFIGGPSQPTGLVIQAAREQGFQGGFLMMDQAKFEEILDVVTMEQLEGAVGVHPQATYPAPGVPGLVERYYERFGSDARTIVSEMAINYQAVHLLAVAMQLAGSTDPDAIREHVDEAAQVLPEELQILDLTSVSSLGQLQRDVYAAQVRNGEFEPFFVPAATE